MTRRNFCNKIANSLSSRKNANNHRWTRFVPRLIIVTDVLCQIWWIVVWEECFYHV